MSSTHNKSRAWVVVAFFTVSMALVSFNLMLYPACTFDTMKMYGVDQAGLTTLSAVVSLTGLCCGLIMGPIIDRIGSRKVVTISLIMAVILFFARVFITSFTAALILTFFASFFLGVCQVAAPKVLDTWYTKENVGTAVSFQAGGAGMGSAVVFAIGAGCGLKTTLLIMTFAALALLIFWIIAGYNGPIEVRKTELPKKAALKVYKSKCVWLLAISYACCVSACATINTYLENAQLYTLYKFEIIT